jgi:hypothetical protein
MTYEIHKNIPIPAKSKYPFADMEIGDCFFITTQDTKKHAQMRTYVSNLNRRHKKSDSNMRWVCRKANDGSLCIWRVE